MAENNTKNLNRIRWVAIAVSAGVTLLALEYSWTADRMFEYASFGLAICGLCLISFMVSRSLR